MSCKKNYAQGITGKVRGPSTAIAERCCMDHKSLITPVDLGESQSRIIRLAILGMAGLICCVVSIFGFLQYQSDLMAIYGRNFPSPTATFTRTPSSTATITPTSTRNSTATQQAIRAKATATYVTSEWRILVIQRFSADRNQVFSGFRDDPYEKSTYKIEDGKYVWDIVSRSPLRQYV